MPVPQVMALVNDVMVKMMSDDDRGGKNVKGSTNANFRPKK